VFQLLSLSKFLRISQDQRLFYLSDGNSKMLPARDELQLRCFAQSQAAHLEGNILRALDTYLDDKTLKQAAPEDWISFWACLWGMILFYGEMRAYYVARTDENFHQVTDKLYRALVVSFSAYFRTKKVHNQLKAWYEKGQERGANVVLVAFAAAWNAKQRFCQSFPQRTMAALAVNDRQAFILTLAVAPQMEMSVRISSTYSQMSRPKSNGSGTPFSTASSSIMKRKSKIGNSDLQRWSHTRMTMTPGIVVSRSAVAVRSTRAVRNTVFAITDRVRH
jgi:hypothetical protein